MLLVALNVSYAEYDQLVVMVDERPALVMTDGPRLWINYLRFIPCSDSFSWCHFAVDMRKGCDL